MPDNFMKLNFEQVLTDEQIQLLADTANGIWHEYFPGIITTEQIDYMVEKFQSIPALTAQIREDGYLYYLVKNENEVLGYIGLHPEEERLFLSKLYLKAENRGKHYASQMLQFIEKIAKERKLTSIYLTVNRYNDSTIAVYRNKGFTTIKEQAADIGNGFVMDDYIMECPIK